MIPEKHVARISGISSRHDFIGTNRVTILFGDTKSKFYSFNTVLNTTFEHFIWNEIRNSSC